MGVPICPGQPDSPRVSQFTPGVPIYLGCPDSPRVSQFTLGIWINPGVQVHPGSLYSPRYTYSSRVFLNGTSDPPLLTGNYKSEKRKEREGYFQVRKEKASCSLLSFYSPF